MWKKNGMRYIHHILPLLALCAGCAATTAISREKAIEIANAKAIENGWKLEEYDLLSINERKYDDKSEWNLFYDGKAQYPGNHFFVTADKHWRNRSVSRRMKTHPTRRCPSYGAQSAPG